MFYIENNTIYITRGDSASLNVALNINNNPQSMNEDDVLTFTVRSRPIESSEILISKSVTGSNIISLAPGNTSMAPGRYSADIQLTTASGDVFTVWPKLTGEHRYNTMSQNNFIVMPDVTF